MNKAPHYLLIGNGRVSKHFQHYFRHLNIQYSVWSRANHSAQFIDESIHYASHVLLLIPDSAIDPFIEAHPIIQEKIMIHFSASYRSRFALSAHPLQTFSHHLYSIKDYEEIPFVLDEIAPEFEVLFPELPNKHYRIPMELKPYYHTLCIMANNFSCLLWQKLFSEFEVKFKIPEEAIFQLLEKSFSNLQTNWRTALTGPIARKDKQALITNLESLKEDPYQEIFKAFIGLMDM